MATTKQYSSKTDAGPQNGKAAQDQQQPAADKVKTVTPDNDNGMPGAPAEKAPSKDSSNKGKGPSGENL